jgi:hypothetical protein
MHVAGVGRGCRKPNAGYTPRDAPATKMGSDEVGAPPACGGERRIMTAPATMQSEAMRRSGAL